MSLELVDRRKEDLDVEDKLFGHMNGFHVQAVGDMAEHVRDARRRALLERREDRPDALDVALHLLLTPLERLGCLFKFRGHTLRTSRARAGQAGRGRGSPRGRRRGRGRAGSKAREELDVPELIVATRANGQRRITRRRREVHHALFESCSTQDANTRPAGFG